MSVIDIWLLAVALAMDCFTVSIMSGVIVRKRIVGLVLRMAFFFGIFQMFIGGKMVKEAFEAEDEKHFNPLGLKTQIALAVATSIDALAVGVSFACMRYDRVGQLVTPLLIIGFVSFALSVVGNLLGVKFGKSISRKIKPELFGGIILILIGVKILVEHIIE